ncbi:hypothetical protein B566_EDAN015971 [Ephemera danica]|nr:hypothetical protein B566_EDAN015971 [Ephemera danica]
MHDAKREKMASLSRRLKISPSKVSAIFFDLDNTLIQTKKGDKQACDKFLKRLLLTQDALDDCPPQVYKSVALSILNCFCADAEIATHPEMLTNVPVFLEIVKQADEDDEDNLMVISETYECLQHIARNEAGLKALLDLNAINQLAEIYADQSFQCDEALNIVVSLVNHFGSCVWGAGPSQLNILLNKIALDFETDHSERKFELADILHALLFNSNKDFVIESSKDQTWPGSVYKALNDILTSKIGKNQRDPALKLASLTVELLGIEWCMVDEEKPKQFFLLLVQLCSIEVRMQLEDRSFQQIMNNAGLLTACFTLMEIAITFVATNSSIELEQKEKQQLYTALKGAFSAIIGLLTKVSKNKDKLTGVEKVFVCAVVRVLAAWLAQETSALRNAVYALLPFLMEICNETFHGVRERKLTSKTSDAATDGASSSSDQQPAQVDVLRIMLPAMCHLTVEDQARQTMLQLHQEDVLFECFAHYWSIVYQEKPVVPRSERGKVRVEVELTQAMKDEVEDAKAAMISLCNIFMNITVLETKLVEDSPLFSQLLRFIFSKLPELKSIPENLVLQGNLAVLGLLLLKQQHKKVNKNDYTICRYVTATIRFLWDAYVVDEIGESGTGPLIVSTTYKRYWIELMELWFLGMQTMSAVLKLVPWISEFAIESGWAEGMVVSLRKVLTGSVPANTRSAYEDFLCHLVDANNSVADLLKKHDALQLVTILREQHSVPHDHARSASRTFLNNFRRCPDNGVTHLDEWRHMLWAQALGEEFNHLAAKFPVMESLVFQYILPYRTRACKPNSGGPPRHGNVTDRQRAGATLVLPALSLSGVCFMLLARVYASSVYRQWLQLRYHFLALTPEVQALLCNLRRLGYRLGLITNGPSRAQWEKVRLLKLEVFFDVILVSGDLPWEKPEARIFLEACSYLQVDPSACLMVGDKLETDILGGRVLGATVWVKPNEVSSNEFQHAEPDFTLCDVTEMSRLLQLVSTPDLEDCNSNASDGS